MNCCIPAFDTSDNAVPRGQVCVVGSHACMPAWMSNGVAVNARSVVDTGGRNGMYRCPNPNTCTWSVYPATPGYLRLLANAIRLPSLSTNTG